MEELLCENNVRALPAVQIQEKQGADLITGLKLLWWRRNIKMLLDPSLHRDLTGIAVSLVERKLSCCSTTPLHTFVLEMHL